MTATKCLFINIFFVGLVWGGGEGRFVCIHVMCVGTCVYVEGTSQ